MREKETRDFFAACVQPRVAAHDFWIIDASDVEMASAFLQENVSEVREYLQSCQIKRDGETSKSRASTCWGMRQFDSGMLMLVGANAAPTSKCQCHATADANA